jgi:hypothetical protein
MKKKQAKATKALRNCPPTPAAPAVRCAFAELVATDKLQPAQGNPNQHPDEQLRLYAKILGHQGWRKPIVVSKQSGRIVTGHGAWLTAQREGWAQVPVDFQDFATPADEAAHMLADNRLPQLADLDEDAFAAVLAQELEGKLDLELAGVLAEAPAEPEPEAQFPIVAQVLERHDFVLVFCDNEMDFEFLQQLAGCRVEKSYKKKTVGIGRAVPFKRFMESLRANSDSLNEPGGGNDDAPAGPAEPGVRAGEPGGSLRRPRRDPVAP